MYVFWYIILGVVVTLLDLVLTPKHEKEKALKSIDHINKFSGSGAVKLLLAFTFLVSCAIWPLHILRWIGLDILDTKKG